MHYTKLFSSIIHSTIWREPDHVRLLFITMLAMKERDGTVQSSLPGLADAARISIEQTEDGLARLSAPDPYSRNPDFEGRRIEKCDGGWHMLNAEYYRDKMNEDDRRAYQAQWIREKRSKHKNVDEKLNKVDKSTMFTQSESESESESESKSKAKKNKEEEEKKLSCPKSRVEFETFYQAYPKKQKKEKAWESWQKINPSAFTFDMILQAINRWKRSPQWTKEKGQFIPMPATWLNNAGWNDEVEDLEEVRPDTKEARTARAAARVIARLEQEERHEPKIIN